jgi:hypothetical protein
VPLFLDIHDKLRAVTPEAIAAAHQRDLEVQAKHGVKYLRYWVNPEAGRMFCLVEAPSKEAAYAMHHEAHGILPNEIYEVVEGA